MADITGNQTVRLRMPVGTAAEIDAAKKKGVFGFDTTAGTVAVCPADAANFVRLGIHPADAPAAASLNGTDLVLIVQGGVLKRTTVADIGGGGVWQPLDSDLTAIASLTTTPFGRSLLTLADAAAARSAIGAGTSSFSGAYASLSGIPAAIDAIDGLTPAADRIPYYTGTSSAALATLTSFARSLLDDADAVTARGTIGAMASTNPNFTGSLYQGGDQCITPSGGGRFTDLSLTALAAGSDLPIVSDEAGVLRNKTAGEFRTIIAAAAADHNHAGIYAPVPAQTSKSGNWSLDANTTTGILQTATGTLTLPAASATYATKSYVITASTTLTLTIAGAFCYLDANNSASYWYDTATSVAFTMNGGHTSGYRKKIEIWCDGQEWLVKC